MLQGTHKSDTGTVWSDNTVERQASRRGRYQDCTKAVLYIHTRA